MPGHDLQTDIGVFRFALPGDYLNDLAVLSLLTLTFELQCKLVISLIFF